MLKQDKIFRVKKKVKFGWLYVKMEDFLSTNVIIDNVNR